MQFELKKKKTENNNLITSKVIQKFPLARKFPDQTLRESKKKKTKQNKKKENSPINDRKKTEEICRKV